MRLKSKRIYPTHKAGKSSPQYHASKRTDPRPTRVLETDIGQEVRRLRRSLDLTVAELSVAAGLSAGMLSKIENGTISSSLATLNALAKALNVAIRDLFGDPELRPNCSFMKAGSGIRINRRGTKVGHLYDLLVDHSFGGDINVEPYLITLDDHSIPHMTFRHSGNEFIFMLSGKLKYRHGDRSYLLEVGDALFFDASARHGPEEFIAAPIKYLSIVTHPSRRKRHKRDGK